MSVLTRCDGCGRDIQGAPGLRLTIESSDRQGAQVLDFCPDPDGRTVGCGRKVGAEIRNAIDRLGKP